MGAVDPYIGVRIEDGGYQLIAKIGEGGMGVVYHGVQEATGTEVAVKILHVKYALENEFVQRFRREVKVLLSLRHPNTVRIIGHGQMDDGSLYIVMELLQGRGLDVALKQDGPWPLERAISMVLRVAYALEEAHRLDIVHRDLKPENIFLVQRPGGVELPKLLDFGLAKMNPASDSVNMSLTQEGDILGTPAFMSPEQSFGESLDGRADIYSLTVILYELLTGLLPFDDDGSGNQIARYLNEPIPLNERVEGLTFPPELWDVMTRALQKLPEDRYSTAMELADALKPFNTVQLSIQPPAVRRIGATPLPPPRTPVPPPPGSHRPPPGSQRSPPGSHRPSPPGSHRPPFATLTTQRPPAPAAARGRVMAVVLVVALLLAAIAGYVVFGR